MKEGKDTLKQMLFFCNYLIFILISKADVNLKTRQTENERK